MPERIAEMGAQSSYPAPPQRHGRAYFVDPDARSVVALAEQIEIFMPLPAAPGGFNRPLQHKAAVPK